MAKTLPSLLVFGPQTTWPTSEYLFQLRAVLLLEPRLRTFLIAIKALPELWQALVDHDSALAAVPGDECLKNLREWIDHGELSLTSDVPPNVLLMPFTIIIHIIQYFHYIGSNDGPSQTEVLDNIKLGGVQGFCTGILTAIAVACSKNEEDINAFGAVALRLALCIGAYVDLDGAFADEAHVTSSLAVRWRSEAGHDRILETLKSYPESYISVIRDSTDVNITAPKTAVTSLAQHLSAQGMTVKSTGLEGRYHSIIHEGAFTKILGLCSSRHDLEFPAANKLIVPVRSNASSQTITEGLLHQHALRDIMIDLANWHLTISAAVSPLIQMKGPLVMSFGLVDSIPSSIVRESGLKVSKFKSSKLFPSRLVDSEFSKSFGTSSSPLSAHEDCRYPDHAIAVIGMACKFPGADNLDEFWQLLTSGTSMLQQMPAERFPTEGLRRSQDGKLRFWGNFVRDIDVFDHRFFKKSSREAATMDPQQRLLLQVAYEAMESSGYFGNLSASTPNDIGCYLGVCANDYNDNVASHPPNAFSSLGTLRAFLSGKISHYFGWKGPSVTYDTACSSSAVAVHSACKAIESGECSQAVAGGVSLYTSPNFYQNLAAASFLSPTGATKPFDANADGYCRGEGVGLVVLKKLSAALTDGDTVLGVITGSAVNQNSNSTPITVPHSPSQVELYQKVCFLSCIDPLNVSFVEAHGTGTPVGDPIEFESIRQVFGSVNRTKSLHVASVKGNIGHLEGASGVAALIKTLLMMQNKTIPVQASFSSLNPKIPALEPDRMAIPLYTQQWDTDRQVACINNYGAAGSNAAMIVCQPPGAASRSCDTGSQILSLSKYPIFISANSTASLVAYCKTLQTLIQSSSAQKNLLSTLAFNLADKQNRSLSHVFATTVSQPIDLSNQLAAVTSGTLQPQVNTKAKPVVLVFGGQVSNAIGLNKNLYDTSILLRSHLDHCDSVLRSIGLSGLYPEVFQTEPVKDIVKLHCALFSVQYSCSKSWVDSGLQISALVGHSFGQLTALCISGTLSLEDGLKLVSGRASLMQTHWSSERGSMISIEADMNTVLNLISSVNTSSSDYKVEIACYNGPTSHVLVGTNSSIEALEDELSQGSIKFKRLNVTHGFHSAFTEPLLPALAKLTEELVYNEPVIPLETCTNDQSCAQIGPQMIADHTRMPVYFGQAIGRLANRLGPCTWLEAGSGSSVTGMVRRSLDTSIVSSHLFQSIQLNTASAVGSLADATTNLWSCGHKFQFWLFHRCQKHEYPAINLPPYQFEKSRHWLPWIDTAQTPLPVESTKSETDHMLLSFVRFRDQGQREAEFCVDPRSKEYRLYVLGHAVLAEPLCPAPLYVELVSQAAMVLKSEAGQSDYLPCVEELEIKAPLGMNVDRAVTIKMTRIDKELPAWTFELTSQLHGNGGKGSPSSHATGRITLHQESPKMVMDFARYEVLIGYKRFDDLKFDPESEIIQGAMVYKSFAKVVQYADYYKGVKSVYARNREVAGNVILPDHDQSALRHTVTKPLAIDNFIQVAGLHVNTLSECGDNEVYVCTKVHHIQAGPKFESSGSWIVYSNFTPSGEREVVNDIFVFDTKTKSLVLIVLGARFMKVLVSSLTKVLSRANTSHQLETSRATSNTPIMPVQVIPDKNPVLLAATSFIGDSARPSHKEIAATDLDADIRKLLHRVTDVPVDAFNDDSTLEELGIDSLMITEVMSEICKFFEFDISATDFQTLLDIKSLRAYLLARGCGSRDVPAISFSRSDSSADSFSSTPAITAATSVENLPAMNDNVFSELAKLITTHLETETTMSRGTNLANEGLDSLLSIELANDIQKIFGVVVDMSLLDGESTFGNLLDMITPQQMLAVPPANVKVLPQLPAVSPMPVLPKSSLSVSPTDHPAALGHAQQAFETIRYDYDVFTKQTGFEGFWKQVYPAQSRLVLAYTVEAFATLGCALASLRPGQRLPQVQFLPKHTLLVNQLQNILTDASLVTSDATHLVRSDTQIDCTPSTTMYQQILQASPHHASEHKLLHITGSKLAKCLTGAADPLQLLFRSKENKQLLEDVYSNGPMYEAINKLLHSFLSKAYAKSIEGGTFHILELGGGTGGTTKYIVDALARENVSFTYTFTDISGSLVTAAKKKFAGRDFLDFLTLDIEKAPPERFLNKFHTIISTNCIHATRDLVKSTTNIRRMLRPDGFVALVEFTRNIFWFDLVFGLLEGWWLYEDARKHVLADEWFWDSSMREAGFKHVTWTDGSSDEARTLRIIAGFPAEPESDLFKPKKGLRKPKVETLVYRQVGRTSLSADIYLPSESSQAEKRPVALLIHGGGHVMFTRKEVNLKQIKILIANGFLPVSVDYRFCPELNILDGPMTDVCEALRWVRHELPSVAQKLAPWLQVDCEKVVAVGWSTGGHLAMTLGFTAPQRGLSPPEAILAFYCPTDYEDDWWKSPIYPTASVSSPNEAYNLSEGIQNEPIASYYPPSNKNVPGMLMSLSDPRWRFVLHMNWRAQTLPFLLTGLPHSKHPTPQIPILPYPSREQIVSISPYAQILRGAYRTPTFLIHGRPDDLIPWQQSMRVHDALRERGVRAGIEIIEGAKHLFDTFPDPGVDTEEAVGRGYEWLKGFI